MDPQVLIRGIEMIEKVLSRVNSKRLMTLYGFYFWLYFVKLEIGGAWTASLGGWATFIVLYSFYAEKTTDALVQSNEPGTPSNL